MNIWVQLIDFLTDLFYKILDFFRKPEDGADSPDTITFTPDVPPPKQRYTWVLDPGHSVHTPGKRSHDFYEYEFNRDIAVRISRKLNSLFISNAFSLPFDCYDKISNDNQSLQERTNTVNSMPGTKILVSIHSNAERFKPYQTDGLATGLEVWYYKNSLMSLRVASVFQRELVKELGWRDRGIKPTTRFHVLRETECPAVLTENGFFTNREQRKDLMKDEIRDKIATAHVNAILKIERP